MMMLMRVALAAAFCFTIAACSSPAATETAVNDSLVCAAVVQGAVASAPAGATSAQKAALAASAAALEPSCQALPAATVAALTALTPAAVPVTPTAN